MKLLIKFPTRNRWKTFRETLDLYYSKLSGKHEVEFLITMDVDDVHMNIPDVWNYLDAQKNLTYCYGQSRSKVEAINANMKDQQFDIVLLASDDMRPVMDGYDDVIIRNMEQHFPDLDGVLHFNDGRVGDALNTLCILGKKYFDRFNFIYHPDYTSLWCDNEFHEVSRRLGKTVYVPDVIIHHAWIDATGHDSLHRRNEGYYKEDEKIYRIRYDHNFPPESLRGKIKMGHRERVRDQRRRNRGR
jgi:hypothetical protein